MMKKQWCFMILSLLLGNIEPSPAQGPSEDYIKMMNSYVPGSPEAAQIMKYVDFPVSYFTGTPQIGLPFYTLTGSGGIAVPVSLSYTAGNGIKTDDQATNTGLGWLLDAGGEITREIRGYADDGAYGLFSLPYPVSYYIQSHVINGLTEADIPFWANVYQNKIDFEPDIYYFNFCGYSGKYIYDDEESKFVCLNAKQKTTVTYNQSDKTWVLVSDQGNRYYFNNKEFNSNRTDAIGISTSGTLSSPEITSWKLSKIVNADGTDSIILNYDYNAYSYYTIGTSAVYQSVSSISSTRPNLNSFTYNSITGISKLRSIVSTKDSISFEDAPTSREDLYNQKAIGKIIVSARGYGVRNIFKFNYSYFNRPALVGIIPTEAISRCQKSLKLDSIQEYGEDALNPHPNVHQFSYNTSINLPCRLSYAKDYWGYANSNTYTQTLAPPLLVTYPTYTQYYDGANRTPDINKLQAGILKSIKLPTGGLIEFQYEPNSIGYPTFESGGTAFSEAIQLLQEFKGANELFNASYSQSFIVNESPNPALNNDMGGVIADISINPRYGTTASGINTAYPYFILTGTPADPNVPNVSISLQSGDMDNVFLPNGTYQMTAYVASLNSQGNLPNIRNFTFKISYKVLDAQSLSNNYLVGGLRVKSITASDNMANITSLREFKYNDPVSDSSYGRLLAPSLNNFYELADNANDGGWLVRMGNCIMPGSALSSKCVVYPLVLENVRSGADVFQTKHYFSVSFPGYNTNWPFTPPFENEAANGNETGTDIMRGDPQNMQLSQKTIKNYEYDPVPQNSSLSSFIKPVYGIKCGNASYNSFGEFDVSIVHGIKSYSTLYNRGYLVSDSTITYDLNNSSRSTTVWHDYTYGDNNMQPIVTRTGNSDGTVSTQKIWYPMDSPEPNSFINATLAAQMALANRITQPLGTTSYKDGTLLSQQYTYGHMDGSKLLTDSMTQAILNNAPETEIKVLTYDDYANPLTILLRGSKYRKYIWNKEKGLPLATAVMGTNSFFYFNSFEYGDGTAGAAFSGTKAYPLSSGALNFLSANLTAETDVYVWANSAAVYINGSAASSTGKTKGNWTLYKKHLAAGTSLNSISGSALIDQLIVLPSGSQFQGNVYDASGRVIAIANDQMSTAFFEYDHFGRLTSVRDEQGNIVKSSTYQIQGAQ